MQVYRNGIAIADASVAGWPWAASGGRIGLIFNGVTRTRVGRFGGGRLAPEAAPVPLPPSVSWSSGDAAFASTLARVAVSNAIPNPVTHDATFAIDVPRPAQVRLAVYDLAGRVVWGTDSRALAAGRTWLNWPGADRRGLPAPTGVYLARVSVDGEMFVRRFTLMR